MKHVAKLLNAKKNIIVVVIILIIKKSILTPIYFPVSLQSSSKIVSWSTNLERTASFTASKPMVLRMILLIKSCHRLHCKLKWRTLEHAALGHI